MAKTAVKFLRGWSRYNTGDVAAFETDQAKGLTDAGIAVAAPPKKPKSTVIGTLSVDVREAPAFKEVQAEIQHALAQIAEQEASLGARAADLDAREDEIANRETALDAREDEVLALAKALDEARDDQADAGDVADGPNAEVSGEADDVPSADAGKAAKGGLPKQGR